MTSVLVLLSLKRV